jgi:hypothetical protein
VQRAVEAVVQAGCFETRYLRAGRGRPVLLIGDGTVLQGYAAAFRLLAAHFRVTAAAVPEELVTTAAPARPQAASWLEGVAEGLGLEGFSLVVMESVASLLTTGLADSRCTIHRMVVLNGMGDAWHLDEAHRSHDRVCLQNGAPEAGRRMDELVSFLLEEDEPKGKDRPDLIAV